eukprot:CAMPEP_0115025672 /NCGR_PEP_ID=MMETSP0216-20121206/34181_1 /TAXON_ID=223996 /ORGANISM="Protocruzia adherens, Strain Boccale" /LENGTH=49 /DNA_ID= /DNA_START= /DNA_END= /DNA_ORIENTATION=
MKKERYLKEKEEAEKDEALKFRNYRPTYAEIASLKKKKEEEVREDKQQV